MFKGEPQMVQSSVHSTVVVNKHPNKLEKIIVGALVDNRSLQQLHHVCQMVRSVVVHKHSNYCWKTMDF